MADSIEIVTLITIIKNLLLSMYKTNKEVKEKIANMTDDEILELSRETIRNTEQMANEDLEHFKETSNE